jgi:uncharacterized protein (DUF1330 family)
MKAQFKLALALIAGAAIGGAVIESLHAQAAPPAYAIVDITNIKDLDGFKALIPKASPVQLAPFGGKYIVRTEKFTAVDGAPPQRFVVIEFDSLQKAKAWAAAPDTQEVNTIRTRTSESRAFIVEGM